MGSSSGCRRLGMPVFFALALEPDTAQLETFVNTMFRHVAVGATGFVSVRTFPDDKGGGKGRITAASIKNGLDHLITVVVDDARRAAQDANLKHPPIFSPVCAVCAEASEDDKTNMAKASCGAGGARQHPRRKQALHVLRRAPCGHARARSRSSPRSPRRQAARLSAEFVFAVRASGLSTSSGRVWPASSATGCRTSPKSKRGQRRRANDRRKGTVFVTVGLAANISILACKGRRAA
jgi:hypothetical protein